MEGWEGSCFLKGYRKRKEELTGALYGIGSCAGNGVWGFCCDSRCVCISGEHLALADCSQRDDYIAT